jgi:hypothetical protein
MVTVGAGTPAIFLILPYWVFAMPPRLLEVKVPLHEMVTDASLPVTHIF